MNAPCGSVDELAVLVEEGIGIVVHRHEMRHQALSGQPGVDLESRGLEPIGRWRAGADVERDLMRGAGAGGGQGAGEAMLDRPVQVAAKDALDMGMPCDEGGQSRALGGGHSNGVHVVDTGDEGWVVHGKDHRPVVRQAQLLLQPGQARLAPPYGSTLRGGLYKARTK